MIEVMKQTPRAYALFDIAKLVLNKPERHHVKLFRKPVADGTRAPLFLVLPSENVFLRQEDAIRFALRHHAEMIFKEKKTPIDPPKGNFTFVNRCGSTGVWLGPPNYHEYQSRLIRHHQQRLRHIPFEEFRARIQTVRDPEAVKAWLDSMSVKPEYECILDVEPKAFPNREELEKHFIENHVAQFVTSAPEVQISGTASRQLQNPAVLESVRLAWQEERKFPMKTANEMRGRLRHEGFHFFKGPKDITYISRSKPQHFESITHLSGQIQKIIVYLREHVGCKRKQLLAHIVPQPAATPMVAPAVADSGSPVSAPAVALPPALSEEERVLADLHWLIQDGYVVEFSGGQLWALPDKPLQPLPVKTPKPAPTSESKPAMTEAPPENTGTALAPPATETVVESTQPLSSAPATASNEATPKAFGAAENSEPNPSTASSVA